MSHDLVRQLSLELFSEIKPTCVELSQIVLLPQAKVTSNSSQLQSTLRRLTDKLHDHYKKNSNQLYIISTKLADYVFFPISGILKQSSLSEDVTSLILEIIGFLLRHSWAHDPNEALLDQLLPLILYLSGASGASKADTRAPFFRHGEPFKTVAISCLCDVCNCLPRQYFAESEALQKRLSVLGDSTTIFLEFLNDFPPSLNQEDNKIVHDVVVTLISLYNTRVDAEKASLILPGIVSLATKLVVTKKNLHYTTIITILQLMSVLIVKVFDDESLKIDLSEVEASPSNLQNLRNLLSQDDSSNTLRDAPGSLQVLLENSGSGVRSKSWLLATSKQLKLSLLSLFRSLFFNHSMRNKVASHKALQDCIFDFFRQIIHRCFKALLGEVVLTFVDIVPTMIFALLGERIKDEGLKTEWIEEGCNLFLSGDYDALKLLLRLVRLKLDDLIFNQLPRVLTFASDENTQICLLCIHFDLTLVSRLSAICLKQDDMSAAIKRYLLDAIRKCIIQEIQKPAQAKKSRNLRSYLDEGEATPDDNRLDTIILPPSINAKNVSKISRKDESALTFLSTPDLSKLSKDWNLETSLSSDTEDAAILHGVYSDEVELALTSLLKVLGSGKAHIEELVLGFLAEEGDLDGSSSMILFKGVSLWMLSYMIPQEKKEAPFSIDEFLVDVPSESDILDDISEEAYALVSETQDMLEIVREAMSGSDDGMNEANKGIILERSFAIAIKSVEKLAMSLPKEQFQQEILMNYLYPLLESLTFRKGSLVEVSGRKTLQAIITNVYNGSLSELFQENSDYIIDSLSLNLSVGSGLTPALPGILLVILKLSGLQLLESNQLHDIISESFIVIDSFHGYSVLMENFFLVFEEICSQIRSKYSKELLDEARIQDSQNLSRYKPWGLKTRHQMLEVVRDLYELADPFANYDPEKEYFTRKPGLPFGEQATDEPDSDDEDVEEEDMEAQEDEKPKWPSVIPENIYNVAFQIFKYGLQLLTHPSDKLKLIILRTLKNSLILVMSNNDRVLPLLADYWPILVSLVSGTQTVSQWEQADQGSSLRQTVEAALEFAIEVLEQDAKNESFMSGKFLSLWEFLCEHNFLLRNVKKKDEKGSSLAIRSIPPKINELYIRLFITGINNYERVIPDLTTLEILKACVRLGIDEGRYDIRKELQDALWVCRNFT